MIYITKTPLYSAEHKGLPDIPKNTILIQISKSDYKTVDGIKVTIAGSIAYPDERLDVLKDTRLMRLIT